MSYTKILPGSNNKYTRGRPIDPWDRQYNGYTGKGCIDLDSDYTDSDLEDFIEDDISSSDEDYSPDEEESLVKELDEITHYIELLEDELPISITCKGIFSNLNNKFTSFHNKLTNKYYD